MRLNDLRNLETATPPAFAGKILIAGDSTARAARTGAMAGAILEQIDSLAGLGGPVKLGNAGYGGYRMLAASGDTRFLDFTDPTVDALGMTDLKAVMTALGTIDAAVILIGPNDLPDVAPASGAIAGYDGHKIRGGLTQMISKIRVHNGNTMTLPVILVLPGQDRSQSKKGGAQTWRNAAVAYAATDAHVHLIDSYDLSIEDSVHRDQSADQVIGFRIGRLLAKHAYSASGIGGPATIASVTKSTPLKVRIVISIPSGEDLARPLWPAGWRVTDTHDDAELRIARLDWIDSNEVDLILHDGATGDVRIEAPFDLVEGFSDAGLIRTTEPDNDHGPGYALQSFAGVAS